MQAEPNSSGCGMRLHVYWSLWPNGFRMVPEKPAKSTKTDLQRPPKTGRA